MGHPRIALNMAHAPGILLLCLLVAAPAKSQVTNVGLIPTDYVLTPLTAQPQLTQKEPIVVPQLTERFEPNGVRVRQRGIIVGKDISRNVMVGLGLVDRKRQRSGYLAGTQSDEGPRRSGKVSALLKLKF